MADILANLSAYSPTETGVMVAALVGPVLLLLVLAVDRFVAQDRVVSFASSVYERRPRRYRGRHRAAVSWSLRLPVVAVAS